MDKSVCFACGQLGLIPNSLYMVKDYGQEWTLSAETGVNRVLLGVQQKAKLIHEVFSLVYFLFTHCSVQVLFLAMCLEIIPGALGSILGDGNRV